MCPMEIEINIAKDSESLIGRMLVRGYSNGEAFETRELGMVGNLRNAMSFLSRDGMSKIALAKTKLSKREMLKILELPKRRVLNYNKILKSIIEDRILSEIALVKEISKYMGMDSIRLSFTAKNKKDDKTPDNMYRYCKLLNELMKDKAFNSKVKELTAFKSKKLKVNSKIINKGKK